MKAVRRAGIATVLAWVSCLPAVRAQAVASAAGPASAPESAPLRRIPLEGAPNFRDLGGYQAKDGKTLKWGRVYRSGNLARLTAADYERLTELNIGTVCDFRTDEERTSSPTRWTVKPPAFVPLPIGYSDSPIGPMLARGGSPGDAKDVFRDYYRHVPFDFAAVYRTVFEKLLADDAPLLFHCTAGKDRTGIFSALLLSALGVPRKTIVDDFLLSNSFTNNEKVIDALHTSYTASFGPKVRRDTVRIMASVDKSYIDAMFDAIESRYGSVREYLHKEMELTDEKLARLRERLLED